MVLYLSRSSTQKKI